MFEHHSHSYAIQALALWASFVPPVSILMLITGAQVERLSRHRAWRQRAIWICERMRFRNRTAASRAHVHLPAR
jgi:hypothetical protein